MTLGDLFKATGAEDWCDLMPLRPANNLLITHDRYPVGGLRSDISRHGITVWTGESRPAAYRHLKSVARAYWLTEDVGFVFTGRRRLPVAWFSFLTPITQYFSETRIEFFRRADGLYALSTDDPCVKDALQSLAIVNALAT